MAGNRLQHERSRRARRSAGRGPYIATAILALLTGAVWGPAIDAPAASGVIAAIIAAALGFCVIALGAWLRLRPVDATFAVITVVVIVNFAVFAYGVSHSH